MSDAHLRANWFEPLIYGNFGWLGQVIPLLLIVGISWRFARKARDMMFIQFPITLGMKMVFPFLDINFVVLSLVLFIMNIVGTKRDIIAEIKSMAIKLPSSVSTSVNKTERSVAHKIRAITNATNKRLLIGYDGFRETNRKVKDTFTKLDWDRMMKANMERLVSSGMQTTEAYQNAVSLTNKQIRKILSKRR